MQGIRGSPSSSPAYEEHARSAHAGWLCSFIKFPDVYRNALSGVLALPLLTFVLEIRKSYAVTNPVARSRVYDTVSSSESVPRGFPPRGNPLHMNHDQGYAQVSLHMEECLDSCPKVPCLELIVKA